MAGGDKSFDPAVLDDEPRSLCVVVIGEGPVLTFRCPDRGSVTIGRSDKNDIAITDAAVSREHAIIHVGETLELEDLGSGNGTRVRGERAPANQRVRIEPRQIIELGGAMLIVQETKDRAKAVRLVTHAYFEARLEERCEKAAIAHEEFAVLRVHAEGEPDLRALEHALTRERTQKDVVAAYAPGEYELLLSRATRAHAEQTAKSLRAELSPFGITVRTGVALFPKDGRTADTLIERSCADLLGSPPSPAPIIQDQAMCDLYVIARRAAQGTISILLLGETGAGKEVLAEAIHEASPRAGKPFVRLNCAALSEGLLESELFGYENGAYTEANNAKLGLLEIAEGGTVFLDELGEMASSTQAKLLRVIEQKQVLRVGGLEPRRIDVRFVAATNRDLENEVAKGNFRRDLFLRLNGVSLRIPPLRERKAEILELADSFLQRVAAELGRTQPPEISERAADLLLGYGWPGNIRELRNVIERAVLLSDSDEIRPEHLPFEKMSATWSLR